MIGNAYKNSISPSYQATSEVAGNSFKWILYI